MSDRPPLVLLHGAGANREMWRPQIERLTPHFTVEAIDLPGHGRHPDAEFHFDAAVAAVVTHLETTEPAVLVGLSLGGYVALGAGAVAPHLTRALVLSGASAAYRGWGGWSTRLYGVLVGLLHRRLQGKVEESLGSAASADVAAAMITGGVSARAAGQVLRRMPGRDYRAMLAAYPHPVLLLNGERDKPNRAEEEDAAAAGVAVTRRSIPDAGHACSLTRPDEFSAAVREFVTSLDTDPGSGPG